MHQLVLLSCLLVSAATQEGRPFHRVERGDLTFIIVERGDIEAAVKSDLVCKVRPSDGRDAAGIIEWLIDEGTVVKKGEVLLRFDPSELRDRIMQQQLAVEQARAALTAAAKEREHLLSRIRLDVESGQGNLELAELDLQEAKNPSDKKRAEIKLRQARSGLELGKLDAEVRRAKAEAALLLPRAALADVTAKLEATQHDLANCNVRAPHDGIVLYPADVGRLGARADAIAVGEPVKAGQKLLRIADPTRLQVRTKIHEASVNRVRPGQRCSIKSAGANLTGKVATIATVADATDWMSSDVKVYSTTIALEADSALERLRPGMTAEVTILVETRRSVLRVPVQAVRTQRGQRVCFVNAGGALVLKNVKTGLNNGTHVEIEEGLREGDEVSLNPPDPAAPNTPPDRSSRPRQNELAIVSVRPSEPRRSFIEQYGLTDQDVAALRSILPEGTTVAVAKRYVSEVRPIVSAVGVKSEIGILVQVTPEYLDGHPSRRDTQSGRPLVDVDFQSPEANVMVIGPKLAAELFPFGDAVGQTVRLASRSGTFKIVGVLRDARLDEGKLMLAPLLAARSRLGTVVTVRASGTRRLEKVQLTEVTLRFPDRRTRIALEPVLREWLARTHPDNDWLIR